MNSKTYVLNISRAPETFTITTLKKAVVIPTDNPEELARKLGAVFELIGYVPEDGTS